MNTRTQQRNAAFGSADGSGMELRFLAANADVKVGDLMATSGLDGVYPAGLPVAKVATVERRGDTSFASVTMQPIAQADSARHVLVLEPLAAFEATRAEAAEAAASAAASDASTKSARKAEAKAGQGGGIEGRQGRQGIEGIEGRGRPMIMPRGSNCCCLRTRCSSPSRCCWR